MTDAFTHRMQRPTRQHVRGVLDAVYQVYHLRLILLFFHRVQIQGARVIVRQCNADGVNRSIARLLSSLASRSATCSSQRRGSRSPNSKLTN